MVSNFNNVKFNSDGSHFRLGMKIKTFSQTE